jgi:aryl-alcohol dehydrogenase-like predicted oxidoreductase
LNKTKIGLGLAALGRPEYINIRQQQDADKSESAFKDNAFKVLDDAYKNGVRHFDTAPSYGKGEQFLIDWHAKNQHPDVHLSTKWGYTYVANWEIGFQGAHEVKEHSLEKLLEQWERSKKLLPALNLYQIHSATFESGILENQEALNQLYKIKQETGIQIGLTTSGVNQAKIIEAALNIKINGDLLFDSFQVTYNILETSSHKVQKSALAQGKTIIVKEALANGRIFKNEAFNHYQPLYSMLSKLSIKYQVGVDAVALRYVIDALQPHLVLSGASNTEQLLQNLKAYDFCLTSEEIQTLQTLKMDTQDYWKERQSMTWN